MLGTNVITGFAACPGWTYLGMRRQPHQYRVPQYLTYLCTEVSACSKSIIISTFWHVIAPILDSHACPLVPPTLTAGVVASKPETWERGHFHGCRTPPYTNTLPFRGEKTVYFLLSLHHAARL